MNDTKNMSRETGMADIQAKVKAMAEIINPNAFIGGGGEELVAADTLLLPYQRMGIKALPLTGRIHAFPHPEARRRDGGI